MTVTIHPTPGADVGDLARFLVDLAGDKTLVRSGRGGFVVSDDLALRYLTEVRAPAPAEPKPLPLALARIAATAEDRGGLSAPIATPPEQKPKPATARTRRVAHEEQSR